MPRCRATPMRSALSSILIGLGACDGQPPRTAVAASLAPARPVSDPGPTALVEVPAGTFAALFPGRDSQRDSTVAAFALERHPVTNAQFLAFVHAEPRWRRSRIAALFADRGYLRDWAGDLDCGGTGADRPVTGVSWFAARAYARWRGRRLPTLAEWERAAAAPLGDGRDPTSAVLAWYGKPTPATFDPVGSGQANSLGLHDLHGLVWEWVDDFAAAMGTGDARSANDLQRSMFCGAGAVNATRPADYAAFLRYAMRGALDGAHTTRNLGFRCAADLEDS